MLITTYAILLLPLLAVSKPHEQSVHNIESIRNLSRHKRGSGDVFGHIKNTVSASIGKASAASAGSLSSGSSKSYAYEKPAKEFDGWALKKSILNTLFQAVKAITGGITAINGQLIKGSGYALSHGGKLVAAGGDVVTNVGKKIALSAQLIPAGDKYHTSHFYKYFGSSSSGHNDHHEEGFSGPSGPTAESYSHAEVHSGPPYLPIPYESNYHVAPTAHEHAQAYHSSYGTGPEVHAKVSNYKKLDSTPLTGQELDKKDSLTALANKKAVEALQLLLSKLPYKSLVKDDVNLNIEGAVDGDAQNLPFKQYDIPRDPAATIPPFKPLQSVKGITSTYTVRLGPIEAGTKHSIGESTSVDVKNEAVRYTYDRPTKTFTVSSPPQQPQQLLQQLPLQQLPLQQPLQQLPLQQQPVNFLTNGAPLDLYHTMAVKHNNRENVVVNPLPASNLYQPYEVIRSVAYEL